MSITNGGNMQEANESAFFDTVMYLDPKDIGDADSVKDMMKSWAQNPSENEEQESYREIVRNAVEANPELGEFQITDRSDDHVNPNGMPSEAVQAMAFTKDDKTYVAFRGTPDGTWPTDGAEVCGGVSPYQQAAIDYFNDTMAKHQKDWGGDHTVIVTGHSQGGNRAQIVTLFADPKYQSMIDRIYSLDGQGTSEEILAERKAALGSDYDKIVSKMVGVHGENDFVNVLGAQIIPESACIFIKSTGGPDNFAFCHDIRGMLFGVNGDGESSGFDSDNFSMLADTADERGAIGEWAKKISELAMDLPPEERAEIAAVVMSIMEQGGKQKTGLLGEKPDLEDYAGAIRHGVPMVLKSLFCTPEGWEILKMGGEMLVAELVKNFSPIQLVGAGIAGIMLAPVIVPLVVSVVTVATMLAALTYLMATLYDIVCDLGKKWEALKNSVCNFIDGVKSYLDEAGAWLESLWDRFTGAVTSYRIKVDWNALLEEAKNFSKIGAEFETLKENVVLVRDSLDEKVKSRNGIEGQLTSMANEFGDRGRSAEQMGAALERIAHTYRDAESNIIDMCTA